MSDLNNKRLLVLGAGLDQCFMLKTARELGVATVALDMDPNAPGFEIADDSAVISNRDVPAIFDFLDRYCKDKPIDGVSTMGSDIPHIVAEVAHFLGTPSIAMESAKMTVDKYAMKQCFRAHKINVPAYELIHSEQALHECFARWGRVVIKPLSQAGSKGVFLISEKEQISPCYVASDRFSEGKGLLVEQYVPGPQLSTESLIVDGEVITPGFADRNYEHLEKFLPQIMENGGWVPSLFEDRRADADIVIQACADALGIKNGVIKGDLVLTEEGDIAVIEVAARLSGGDFCESLVPLASGVNYVAQVIRQSLGLPVQRDKLIPTTNYVVANRYFFPPAGLLVSVEGVELARQECGFHKFELWHSPGETLPEINAHGCRGGVFVVSGESREEVQALIDKVYHTVIFNVR